jgi:hypothetical protein
MHLHCKDSTKLAATSTHIAVGPIIFWPQQMENQEQQHDETQKIPMHKTNDSAGPHRARQAAEQARTVAAAVAIMIATAAAADRATPGQASYVKQSNEAGDSASNDQGEDCASWRGVPQLLTEQALLLLLCRTCRGARPGIRREISLPRKSNHSRTGPE